MNWINIVWALIAAALTTSARAADLAPESRFYGVAHLSQGASTRRSQRLSKRVRHIPATADILEALASFNRDRRNDIEARRSTEQLRAVAAGF